MNMTARQALLDAALDRAAEALGDLTAPVIAHFYQRHPDAPARFDALWPGDRTRLEGEMVAQALYCLMYWLNSPGEIEIMLGGSVPHHARTLAVPPHWYAGLLDSCITVVRSTIPPDNADERQVCDDIRRELLETITAATAGC